MSTSLTVPAPVVFRSQFAPLRRICIAIAVAGAVFLFAAAVIGQIRADRFPDIGDLLLALLIPPAAGLLAAGLFAAMIAVFKIEVRREGLRCYDTLARYRVVPWAEMTAFEAKTIFGLPYLYIAARGLSQPLTLPLWLDDLPRFIEAVEAQAGEGHPLVKALLDRDAHGNHRH